MSECKHVCREGLYIMVFISMVASCVNLGDSELSECVVIQEAPPKESE